MLGHEESSDTLSAGEVARVLHLHINTVRRWSDNGIIRSHRIGPRGDRIFSLQDITQHLEEARVQGQNGKV